jgi:hypothetical protein
VDVLQESKVCYSDSDGNPAGCIEIPQEWINVKGQKANLQIVEYRWSTDPAHQPPYEIIEDGRISAYIEARIENQGPGNAKDAKATISGATCSDADDCKEIIGQELIFDDVPVGKSDAWSTNDYHIICCCPTSWVIKYVDECGENREIPEPSAAPPLADMLFQLKSRLIPQPPITKLYPNYPNPFNPETWIPYQVAKDADVLVRIFDMRGQRIKTIVLGHQQAGFYISRDKAAYWDGRNQFGEQVSSGVYFYNLHVREAIPRIGAGDFTATRKMIIMK